MKRYLAGLIMLFFGAALLVVVAYGLIGRRPILMEELHLLIEARSEPMPPKLKDILPLYPESQGVDITQQHEITTVTATALAHPAKILTFYETELEGLGWRQDVCEKPEETVRCFSKAPFELTVSARSESRDQGSAFMVVSVEDETLKYHPEIEDDAVARQLLDAVEKTYRTCSTYLDTGREETRFLNPDGSLDWTSTEYFKTAFVRPDRFRYEVSDNAPFKSFRVIHADTSGVREWDDTCSSGIVRYKSESLWEPLSSVHGVPCLLTNEQTQWPLNLQELTPPEEEVVAGIACYRINGKDRFGEAVTLWIDRDKHVLTRMTESSKYDGFSTESVTTWDARVDGSIPDRELAFRPFGPIPIPLGIAMTRVKSMWDFAPLLLKLLLMSGLCLILAGVLHTLRTRRRVRRERPVTVADPTAG